MNDIRIEPGKRIRIWAGWYRHDSVFLNGKKLEGSIQVRRRFRRTDIHTGFRDCAVLGHDVNWLITMNRIIAGVEVVREILEAK